MFYPPFYPVRDERQGHEDLPARELAQRQSGTHEVQLFWYAESDEVELAVRDVATGAGFRLDVAPDRAIDAFYHPYAYAAWREDSEHVVRAEMVRVDD